MPDTNWVIPPENIEFSNETPSQFYIDLIKEANLARSKGLRAIDRVSILETAFKDKTKKSGPNWIRAKAAQELLDEYRTDFRLIAANYFNNKKLDFFNQGWIVNQ
jgi:flagellar biosynthesis component FlhA